MDQDSNAQKSRDSKCPPSPKNNKGSSGWLERNQKGEMENPSPEVAKVAATAKRSDVKKFASTKHKGLPMKKKNLLTRKITIE